MSTLKVGTIQDHANSNTAISIDSTGATCLSSTTKVYVQVLVLTQQYQMVMILHGQ